MKRAKVGSKALAAVVVGVVLVYAVAGWFLLVAPKRSQASKLGAEIADAQVQLARARVALRPGSTPPRINVADLFRLGKAMPAMTDMPGILLELSRVADETGIAFESITPQRATSSGTYQVLPIQLVFDGNYYELSDFLFRLRNLVAVHDGKLEATGRLFSVDRLEFAESPDKFPNIQAALTVSAFVYGPGSGAPPAAAAPTTTTTEPDSGAPTVPAAPPGATASGVTP